MINKKFLQLSFSDLSSVQKELLLALLADIDYSGFEEEDVHFNAYIDEADFNQDKLDAILKIIPVRYNRSVVEQQNWNAEWESSFQPIVIGDFAAIRAGFHAPVRHVKHEVIITPKMSFGTGHHATTHMMIEEMSEMDFKNKSVVDFGTGTAVLAILSEKMGAGSVDAIDNDDWSIENAKENIVANNCSGVNISKAEELTAGKTYNIILANINLNVIVDNLPRIMAAAQRETEILLSGFLKQDEAGLLQLLTKFKVTHANTRQSGEWICLKLKMN